MKKIFVLFMLCICGVVIAYQSSSESVNPFNQFNASSGGISLFTGGGTYGHSIVTLTTKGSLSLPISLAYSSNVEINARSKNGAAPTTWVGLGWNISFGRISCSHNGTITDSDDDYTWISPDGVAYPLLYKNGAYKVKDRPFMKIERTKTGDLVYGWTLTDESGNKYKYGDFNDAALKANNLNWNTLCWLANGYVGTGFTGEPTYFPYQWDLSEMSDLEGNWIRFKYEKMNGNVSYSTWNPTNKFYTKESYVKEITTNNGTAVQFVIDSKSGDEYYVPYTGVADGAETNQPCYETKYLKEIVVTNTFSSLAYLSKIYLEYDFLNSGDFMKRLLTRITTENGKADNGIKGKVATWFTYYKSENDPRGCYGALRSVKNHMGGETIWEFEKKNMSQVFRRQLFPQQLTAEPQINTGTASDGEDFYTIWNANDKRNCHTFKWHGTYWQMHTVTVDDDIQKVYTGANYFIISYGAGKSKMKLLFWDGENWREEHSESSWGNVDEIYPSINSFLVKKSNREVWSYKKNRSNNTWYGWNEVTLNDYKGLAVGSNYMAMYDDDDKRDRFFIKNWNGNSWSDLRQITRAHDGVEKIYGGADAFVEYYDIGDDEWFSGYKHNGNDWESRFCANSGCTQYSDRIQLDITWPNIVVGNDFYILNNTNRDNGTDTRIYNWNGHVWNHTKTLSKGSSLPIGGNSFAEKKSTNFVVWKWDSKTWSWVNGDYGSDVNIGYSYELGIGGLFQVAEFKNSSNQYTAKINMWDGKGWHTEDIVNETNDLDETPDQSYLTEIKSVCGQKSFVRKCKFSNGRYILVFRRKFQDSFINEPYCFVVSKRIVRNGVDQNTQTVTYNYETSTANYNATIGTGMFKKVTITQAGAGSVSNYFENSNFRLMGSLTKTESIVSKQETEYEIYRDPSWHENLYQKRAVKVTTTKDGVRSERLMQYKNTNGMMYRTVDINSDGKYRVSETTFACEKTEYLGMKNLNMLTQPYGSKTIYFASEFAPAIVVASNITLWNSFVVGSSTRWRPVQGYSWRVPMGNDGLPLSDPQYQYAEYIIGSSGNNNWIPSGKTEKYDEWGRVIDAHDASGLHSITVMGNKAYRGIAAAKNATYDECAFYTCNYDNSDENANYLDFRNGWEKCGAVVNGTKGHFSKKSVYIDLPVGGAFGPSRNVRILQGKNYIFSAWVFVESGTLVMDGDYRYITNNSIPFNASARIKGFGVAGATATSTGKWQLLQLRIPAKTDLTDWTQNWGVRIFVGSPNGVKAYVDDIRFYPENAMATTTYYDDDWRHILVAIDENNNPSNRAEYDGFGRPVRAYKIDKTKSYAESGAAIKTQEKEYQFMKSIRVLSPNGGESWKFCYIPIIPPIPLPNFIKWETTTNIGNIKIELVSSSGSSWAIQNSSPNDGSFTWFDPTVTQSTGYKIRISSVDDPTIKDETDGTFRIVGCP